jgi:hypothetical protein
MLSLAIDRADAEYLSGPEAIAVGTDDDMYIPTTQIRIIRDGEWHKRGPIAIETACGHAYSVCASREYQLNPDDELCTICFTPRERWLAKHPEDLP